MSVDKFGRSSFRPVSGRSGLSLRIVNNNFLRRDGTNTVTGPINMNGHKLKNASDPMDDQDVATKSYVDSIEAADKVSKSGDTMTGNLILALDTDTSRILGCTYLRRGTRFSLAIGHIRNRFEFRSPLLNTEDQSPLTLETTHGLLVRVGNTRVCQIGDRNNPPTISVSANIEMNDNRILYLDEPAYPHEAASKNYVDRKFLQMSLLNYEGHIPPLERANSKTGFVVSTSSRLDAFHEGWVAFNSAKNAQWQSAGEGAGAWIQITCPAAVRIWKIRLTGLRENIERITSWSLGGRNGESESLTNILDSETTLGSEMQEFLSPTSQSYSTYRLTVRSAEQGNTGLSHFQIFIKTFYGVEHQVV